MVLLGHFINAKQIVKDVKDVRVLLENISAPEVSVTTVMKQKHLYFHSWCKWWAESTPWHVTSYSYTTGSFTRQDGRKPWLLTVSLLHTGNNCRGALVIEYFYFSLNLDCKSQICIYLLIGILLWCFKQQHGRNEMTALRHPHLGKQLSELIQSPAAWRGLFHQLSKKHRGWCCVLRYTHAEAPSLGKDKQYGPSGVLQYTTWSTPRQHTHTNATTAVYKTNQSEAVCIAWGCVNGDQIDAVRWGLIEAFFSSFILSSVELFSNSRAKTQIHPSRASFTRCLDWSPFGSWKTLPTLFPDLGLKDRGLTGLILT